MNEKTHAIEIEGRAVKLTNPEKLMWPEQGIRKIDYLARMLELGRYILPHARDRLLTAIRFPDGVRGKSFYQKNAPVHTPDWVEREEWNGIRYVLLNSLPTLAWLINQAVLEFHTSFNLFDAESNPTYLVFDLDPSQGQTFEEATEVALLVYDTLNSLSIESCVKTSGATGLQIYIPVGGEYTYDTARKINKFFGQYFSSKYPERITIERVVKKRGKRLYFDYLQMWQGKTITMAYSPRAGDTANISMPVTWEELKEGVKPEDFTLCNAFERLREKGDVFAPMLGRSGQKPVDEILRHIEGKE